MTTDNLVIGFVGLGMMGLPMVENLSRAPGMRVLAHDAQLNVREALQALPQWGASLGWAEGLRDLAGCAVVITMLPNSTITSAVLESLLPLLGEGQVVVDMGSSHPLATQALASKAAARGVEFVDAPVSGSVAKARAGTLTIMAGGSDAGIERARPVLERIGGSLLRTGSVGSAHAMKALNNYLYAAGLLAMSEAVTIAARLDLDLGVFADVLNASSGRNVATETKLTQFVIPRTFSGGFQLRLQAKDLATANDLCEQTGVDAPQLALCAGYWRDAAAGLDPAADNTEILRVVENRSSPLPPSA